MSAKEKVETIKNEIKTFYSKHGLEAKVIYRTCASKFGDESPGNLIPLKSERENNHINIYVDFRNGVIDENNISFIVAFPDKDSDLLPRLEKVRLPSKRDKIDLRVVNYPYRFNSLNELYNEYFKRFHHLGGKEAKD